MKNIYGKNWNKVGENELRDMCYNNSMTDREIAELYGVTISQVRYKRNKYNISIKNCIYEKFMNEDKELFSKINEDSKKRLFKQDINVIAIALTHYLFRNGPIEDMHANNQLSQEDMKKLNKYMVNKIAGLLMTCHNNEWLKLELLLNYMRKFGIKWDKPEPDVEELNAIFEYEKSELKM